MTRWIEMTGPVGLEEWADRRVRDSAERPMDLSALGRLPDLAPIAASPAAPSSSRPRPRSLLEGLSVGAEHTSRFLDGKEGFVKQAESFANSRGLMDLDNFNRVAKGLGNASRGLSIAGEALGAADDYRKGVPLKVVVPGAVMHGGAAAAGGLLGGALLSPLGPLGMAAGGIIGSYLADKYLPERKVLGESFNKAMEESAERPYYSGSP